MIVHFAIGGGPLALAVACRYNEQSPRWKRTMNIARCTCERCRATMRGREAADMAGEMEETHA